MRSTIRIEFQERLASFRRRVFLHRFPGAAIQALCLTLAAAVVFAAAVRFAFAGWSIFGFLPLFWAGLLVFFWLRRRPSLSAAARLFDQLADNRSAAVNALELIRRDAEGVFADYAVAYGLSTLKMWNGELPGKRLRWKSGAGFLAATLLILFLPLPSGGGATGIVENKHAVIGRNSGSTPPDIIFRPSAPAAREARTPSLRNSREALPDSGKQEGEAGTSSAAADENRSGASAGTREGRGGGSPGNGKPEPGEPSGGPEVRRDTAGTREENAAGGLAGSSGAGGEDDGGLRTEMQAGASGGNRVESGRERSRKEVRRKDQEARGGLQPLLPDNAPPAGRELSEKDGKGDRPGDGRGGETGAKKSRGAAAALPVIPLPDTVTGRLGTGEDITSVELAPPGSGVSSGTSAPGAAGSAEPPGRRAGAPAAVRKAFRESIATDTDGIL